MVSKNNSRNFYILRVLGIVIIGGLLYGYDLGVISGALLFIKQSISMTDNQLAVIVGAVFIGGLLGTMVAGTLADYLGRRFVIGLSSVIFISGIVCILFSHSFIALLFGRLLLGIGVGFIAVIVPLYTVELAPAKDRGKYITAFQLILTIGILLSYIIDTLFITSGNWRGMFSIILIPAIVLYNRNFFLARNASLADRKTKKYESIKNIKFYVFFQRSQK